jgi:hypothetical protein
MAEGIDSSKHFRRLDDGRYLFREGRWSRTVVLGADTARRVHEGREPYLRKSVRRNTVVAAIGVGLGRVLHRSNEPLATILLLMGVAVIIACREHALRERAYYKWVRGAPSSDQCFPVRYSFQEIFERMAAARPLWLLILTTVLGTLLTLFFLTASAYYLLEDPLRATTFIFLSAALFAAVGTASAANQWRLKRRMLRATADKQRASRETD